MRATKLAFSFLLSAVVAGCGDANNNSADLSAADADCLHNPGANECAGGCLTDDDCKRKAPSLPRCEATTNKCVACLPTSDNCGSGQVCQLVNNTYQCLTTCGGDVDCQKLGGGSSCCGGVCVSLATDVAHCGACPNTCAPVNNGEPGCIEGHCIIGACNAGFDDCNRSPDDGCETPTGSDPMNCGGCGTLCQPYRNGIPACSIGTCSASCAPGYADCNNQIGDGCEVDITFEANNCGACGKVCTAPANSMPSCDQGTCGFRCKAGFANCDGNPNNGCEASVNGDANNCGHCGNICPVRPNAANAVCNSGLCGSNCNPNFGDCDGNLANGCESNTLTDLNNCGGCGQGCLNKNATATCAQGVCTVTCNKGFFDCNMSGKDGCESNPLSDAVNCGGCGNACPQNNPWCSMGQCGQVPPYPMPCTKDNDAQTGSPYIVCTADGTGAFIAGNPGGSFHAGLICQKYLYKSVDKYGGTCGTVCGYCNNAFNCMNPQNPPNFDGGGLQGSDGPGLPILGNTVHWHCIP